MALVQDDHVIQALATDAPNQPFHVGVLPWALGGNADLLDPHVPHPLLKVSPVDTIKGSGQARAKLSANSSMTRRKRHAQRVPSPRCSPVLH
jgi:hypothetical protein